MKTSHRLALASLVSAAFAPGLACSGETNGLGNDGAGANGNHGQGGGVIDVPDSGTPNGDFGPDAACVTSSASAEGAAALLVVQFDRSCSMDEMVGAQSKWQVCASALKAFFADPTTTGLSASLAFFPQGPADDYSCNPSDYVDPLVPMQPLPAGPTFGGAIDQTSLKCATPTVPALQGAIQYAQDVGTQHPGEKVAIVLVTDGLPDACDPSSVDAVASAAAAVASTIPTYVIGIGDALQNLDAIAQGGGTNKAIVVSTQSPDQVTADLVAALGTIKNAVIGCEYAIPPPPAGQDLDASKVNITYTPSGGSPITLGYSETCQDGEGWHYDNPSAPTKIEICPKSCAALESDPAAQLTILFGCATQQETF